MLKSKTVFIYASFILIIILSFAIPKFTIKIQDEKILSNKYTINKKLKTFNENSKLVGLVETIYSKYNTDKYNVKVSDIQSNLETIIFKNSQDTMNIEINSENTNEALNKFQELVKLNIINQDFYNQFLYKSIIYRTWNYDNGEIKYKVIKIFTQDSLQESVASIDIENETNKIVGYTVKKEYSNINQETLLEYAKYLELYSIFDDWEYKDNELRSKTSGIKIAGNNNDRYIFVKLMPFKS